MMKIVVILLLVLSVSAVNANDFSNTDQIIHSEIISWLDKAHGNSKVSSDLKPCLFKKKSLTSLKICHQYIESIYVTEDIDSHMVYINQLLYLGVNVSRLWVYRRILDTQYDEVISQMYFNIAKSSYLYGRYDHALKYLKKIDDYLEDKYVYHALLIYGLIYFEQGKYKRAQKYFSRITERSKHYASAQFNLGLINMRSLWWSDAEENLNNAISSFNLKSISKKQSMFLDRLYLTVGYSQLSRKDFRAAKKSFTTISIDSEFKSRALMGIALSEIGLSNFGKAASLLKLINKTGEVTVKLDALVTLPQVYHKAGNIKQTIKYYDVAIKNMTDIMKNIDKNSLGNEYSSIFSSIRMRLDIVNNLIYLKKSSSQTFTSLKIIRSRLSKDKIDLIVEINNKLKDKIINYRNQSKYALATIYDASVVQK